MLHGYHLKWNNFRSIHNILIKKKEWKSDKIVFLLIYTSIYFVEKFFLNLPEDSKYCRNLVIFIIILGCASSRYTIQQWRFMHKLCKHAYFTYTEKSWYQGSKNLSMICKDLVSWVKKINLTKEVAIFKSCCFLFWNFMMKIYNFPEFNSFQIFLFCLYFRKFLNSLVNYPQDKLAEF